VSEYKVARLDQIEEISDGREPWRPIRLHFGITSFGVNAWTGHDAGDRIINEHAEDDGDEGDEELYLVQNGRARFELEGDRVDAPAGTFVFVPAGVRRTAYSEEPETTILAIGASPGQAYEPSGWELWASVRPLYAAGDYAAAADRAKELVDAHPEYPLLLYNLACCESLAGRKDEAIEHLRLAAERSDRARTFAAADSDFDAIRDEPAFEELFG
jgi:tetratricopeptide (TPR) repeat protein